MFNNGTFVLNEFTIHYVTNEDSMNKPVLFLVHGLNPAFNSWKVWEKNLHMFSTIFKIYAFDLCGYNESLVPASKSFDTSSAVAQAEIISKIIEKEDFSKVSLCGLSWGCSVINEVINIIPEKITLTIFVSPALVSINLAHALEEGKIPVIIVNSPQDPVIPYIRIQELANALPHATILNITVPEQVEPVTKIHHIQSLKADEFNERVLKTIHHFK